MRIRSEDQKGRRNNRVFADGHPERNVEEPTGIKVGPQAAARMKYLGKDTLDTAAAFGEVRNDDPDRDSGGACLCFIFETVARPFGRGADLHITVNETQANRDTLIETRFAH